MDLKIFFTETINGSDLDRLMTPALGGKFPLQYENIMRVPLRNLPGSLPHSDKYLFAVAAAVNALSAEDAAALWEEVQEANSAILIGTKTNKDRLVRT